MKIHFLQDTVVAISIFVNLPRTDNETKSVKS